MPDFRAIISQQLEAIDTANPADRNAVYTRVRDVLQKAIERSQDQSKLLDHLYELDRVIDDIERSYAGAPSRVDQMLAPVRSLSTQAKLKYGAVAGLVTTIADFVKPLLELTVPIMIGSGVGIIVLLAGSCWGTRYRPTLRSGAFVCTVLFVCASGWWCLQHIVRGANANGAVAEIIPGASAIQNAFLSRLSRIETETKRVADLLEKQSQLSAEDRNREAAIDEEFHREGEAKKNLERERIKIAGYTADAEGLVKAFKDKSDVIDGFGALQIEPTEAAVRAVAPTAKTLKEVGELSSLVRSSKSRKPDMYRLKQSFDADGEKLAIAFQEAAAKTTVCDPRNYSLLIGPDLLKKACALDGLRFAEAFAEYFTSAYTHLHALHLMQKATSALPVEKVVGSIWPGQIKSCGYYEGELDYFHRGSFVRPSHGTISARNSTVMVDVWKEDPQFGEGSQGRCPLPDVQTGRARFCRARVIVASSCKDARFTVIKTLATLR